MPFFWLPNKWSTSKNFGKNLPTLKHRAQDKINRASDWGGMKYKRLRTLETPQWLGSSDTLIVFLLGTSLRFSMYIDRSLNTHIYIYIYIHEYIITLCIHTSSIVYCTFRSGTECVGFVQYVRFRPHNFKRKKLPTLRGVGKSIASQSVTWQTLSARVTELHTF